MIDGVGAPAVEWSLYLAAFVGGLLQCAVGIGFSVVVGPLLLMSMSAKAAVPQLLALNLLVSCVAMLGSDRKTWHAAGPPAIGVCAGLLAGVLTYPLLDDTFLVLAVAGILLVGAIPGRKPRRSLDRRLAIGVGTLSGVATAWTATPGPLMALGFAWAGYSGDVIRRIVQPIALLSYGAALALHGVSGWMAVTDMAARAVLPTATILGSLAGLAIGSRLPAQIILPVIRFLSFVAGSVLLWRVVTSS